jgi:hypothetical protein
MAFLVGFCLALVVCTGCALVGLDRDRALYPLTMIVIASYYCLYAVIGGSTEALLVEVAIAAVFVTVAVLGFRGSLWWVAAALVAHGLMDFVHGGLVQNPGVPPWWPAFCAAYDVTAGAALAWLLWQRRIPSRFGAVS